jgi:hypothetical protein
MAGWHEAAFQGGNMIDPTPIIYWVQPDGSRIMEWPDGDLMIYSKEEWALCRSSLPRGETVYADYCAPEVDTSDIPETDEGWFKGAKLKMPDRDP